MKNKSKDKKRVVKKREVESASDSEDDKYKVHKKDDESVDDSASDIGWNSDDEVAFDSRRKRDDDEDEEEYYSDDDDMEGGMLLSDMLDMPKKAGSKAPAIATTTVTDEPESEAESADEEGSEMYSDDDESDSDLDEEYSEEAHNKLLKSMDKFSKSADAQMIKSKSHANQNAKESVFSSMLDGSVSMNALLGALENTQDLSAVRQQLTDLTKSSAAPTFVDKVVSDRAERGQAYESSRQDMSKWQETVVTNRHKRVLDLAGDKRQLPSTKQLVTKFTPSTSMEREIQMILVKHGTSDAAAAELEQDELQARGQLSEKEIKERQGELAKIKALMFYEQMKRHRLNKIKSKAYRTIQKRQRKREQARAAAAAGGGAAGAGEDSEDDLEEGMGGLSEEQREQAAFERVKERMDMRHSSTSKWSRMALRQGQQGDKNKRAAYHESVLLGHELTAKMTEDTTNSSSKRRKGEDKEVYRGENGVSEDAAAEMQHILSGESNGGEAAKVDGRYSKLFDMDFMKKAANQQRERSREEAESLLREIEEMEQQEDSDDDDVPNNNKRKSGAAAPLTAGVAVKRKRDPLEEQQLALARGEMTSALNSGSSSGLFVSGGAAAAKKGKGAASAVILSTPVDLSSAPVPSSGKVDSSVEANPWLMPAAVAASSTVVGLSGASNNKSVAAAGATIAAKGGKAGKSTNTMVKIAHNPSADSAAAGKIVKGASSTSSALSASTTVTAPSTVAAAPTNSKLPARTPLLMQKSQADLVKIAFSGPDYEGDFDTYKNKTIDDELGTSDKTAEVLKNVKAGWGDWAGPGNQMVSKKIQDKRDRLITKIQSESEAKRMERKDNKMMNVMISERRIKTASKYKIADIPHPYTSWEEYDRSLQMPLGEEWNASNVVKNMTQPAVKTRAGRIIEPVKLTKQMNKTK